LIVLGFSEPLPRPLLLGLLLKRTLEALRGALTRVHHCLACIWSRLLSYRRVYR
jgi:hypothetical protein